MIEEHIEIADGQAARRSAHLPDASAQRAAEWETIAAIRVGNELAYERVFRDYYGDLCRFAVRYVRDADLAEDVVQVVLGELWIRREAWHVQTTIAAYLYGATRNAAVTRLRQLERARRLAEEASGDPLDGARALEPTVIQALEQQEKYAALSRGLATLSDRRRTMLLLRIVYRLSYREIALVTQTSIKNVEVTLNRAVAALRRAVVTPPS